MQYKVLIEDAYEISGLAQLLFVHSKEFILDTSVDFEFYKVFNSEDDAKAYIKSFVADVDEPFKDDWSYFIAYISDDTLVAIESYSSDLRLLATVKE